jgi:translocation and assembly module TamB
MMNDTQAGTGTVKINDRLTTLSTTTDTDLQALNIFIHNTHHRITGNVIANINLDNGIISGDVAVKNGTYRNLLHGTMIDTINMQSTITPDFINVLELTAKSQPIGTLNAKGIISVSPTTESNFIMTMSELTPLKNTMLSLNADSTLNLVGNSNNLKLTGQIKLNDLLILLPDLKANNTPKLTIIRPSDVPTTPTETESIPLAERVQTDIAVSITEGAKIVGFGLQGFPYGTLQIRGTLGTPKIDGQIDIARGKIDFFGKNFKIINGGIAIKQTNPIFNIQATHTIDKKIINLSLKGTVQSPDIVLSSTPQIPKDEIIALLVFGRNKNELSPFQALQLANTVYQLSRGKSGAGSTFDIIGKTERLLNIDELNINSGDNNSVNIGAGKYISEDIYVATEYNPTTASSLFRLEFKLSDSVDLITRLNTSNTINNTNNSELMLIKNKDY